MRKGRGFHIAHSMCLTFPWVLTESNGIVVWLTVKIPIGASFLWTQDLYFLLQNPELANLLTISQSISIKINIIHMKYAHFMANRSWRLVHYLWLLVFCFNLWLQFLPVADNINGLISCYTVNLGSIHFETAF